MSIISISGLKKSFGDRLVLDIEEFDLSEGTTLAIIGPNGAGKTTLLRILSGLWLPTSAARIKVLGYDLTDERDRRSRRELSRKIGLATSSSQLFGTLTVRENLDYACRLFSVPRGAREKAVERALELCGIAERADDQIWSLSTGLRQRANIARAVVTGPSLLFLDEPTSGLDPIAAAGIHDTFRALTSEGISLVLCTHVMQEVDDLCDRVSFLSGGRIIADGTPDELRAMVGEWVWRSRVTGDALSGIESDVARVPSAKMVTSASSGGETEVTVFGDVGAELFESRGLAYERHAPQLRDAFFYLGGSHGDV